MRVVCNTSPLVALARAKRLDVLPALFAEITLPNAVFDEVCVAGAGEPGAIEIASAAWVKKQQVTNTPLVTALRLELDAGEAEAIALAIEAKADWVLLDERIGRRVAARFGLTALGTLGLLVMAKQRGILSAVRPVLDVLRTDAGFWIRDDLYNAVLASVKE